MTMDMLPHIGKHEDIYYAVGLCGHGVSFGTYLGKKLAAFILDSKLDTELANMKFRAIPLYNGRPWFVPFLGKVFRLMDMMGIAF